MVHKGTVSRRKKGRERETGLICFFRVSLVSSLLHVMATGKKALSPQARLSPDREPRKNYLLQSIDEVKERGVTVP